MPATSGRGHTHRAASEDEASEAAALATLHVIARLWRDDVRTDSGCTIQWAPSPERDPAPEVEHHFMTATVFTIGYEARDASGLISDLAAAGVAVLVDVRELPLSRRRGFSKTALRAAVEDAGMAYVHERAVGNPKPFRDAWKAGDTATGAAGYVAHLHNGSKANVDALARRVAEGGVCLMCVENDPSECHRSLLVDALRERLDGLQVEHL